MPPLPPSLWDWLRVSEVDLGRTWLMLEMLEDLLISLELFLAPAAMFLLDSEALPLLAVPPES